MYRISVVFSAILLVSTTAWAGSDVATPYGTVVNKDGSMVVLYKSQLVGTAYAVKVSKNGKTGGCERETMSAYQLRKAFAKASSKWRAGYIPRGVQCQVSY